MGCGASVPQNGQPAITRVGPSSQQAVSEANAGPLNFQPGGDSGVVKVRPLEKILSMNIAATPGQILEGLLVGNGRFRSGTSAHPHQDAQRVQAISSKQMPVAAVLGCADSRVPIEIVFDQGFGDLFVCRVAGNIATAEEVASLEYAVLDLGVRVIMVLGHTKCGAVKAALSGKHFPGLIEVLVDQMDVAITRVDSVTPRNQSFSDMELVQKVVYENVRYQVQRCHRSPVIKSAIQSGNLTLVGAVYDLGTGQVEIITTQQAD